VLWTQAVIRVETSFDIFFIAYSDLQIRLVNPNNNQTGRVEIYHPSFGWGTVCGWRRWTKVEGGVVCRQLNFTGAKAVTRNSYPYGKGSGPILLDIIKCTGNESCIWECSHLGWNLHFNSNHDEDVGVDCYWCQACQVINIGLEIWLIYRCLCEFFITVGPLKRYTSIKWSQYFHKFL
jgi:hypothetical protein